MKVKKNSIPIAMQDRYFEITKLTNQFSEERLTPEYADLAEKMVAQLSRKKPSPIQTGSIKVWACGVIHALGVVNFLYDKETNPYVSNQDLIQWFGVGQSTASGKSKQIREMLKISQMSREWMLTENYERIYQIVLPMAFAFSGLYEKELKTK